MTHQDQIKAIAELDGIKYVAGEYGCTCNVDNDGNAHYPSCKIGQPRTKTKKYLTSRDAIIPVIEKCIIAGLLGNGNDFILNTNILMSASQLSEAILKSVGKWKD